MILKSILPLSFILELIIIPAYNNNLEKPILINNNKYKKNNKDCKNLQVTIIQIKNVIPKMNTTQDLIQKDNL